MIPVFTNNILKTELQKELHSWIGTPYFHWGQEKGKSADCSLFIARSLININVLNDFILKYQSRIWVKYGNEEILLNIFNLIMNTYLKKAYICKEILDKNEQLIIGDFLVYSINSKFTNHMSMLFNDTQIIESNNKNGVCLQTILNNIFKITHIYRIYLQ